MHTRWTNVFRIRLSLVLIVLQALFALTGCGGGTTGTYVHSPEEGGSITLQLNGGNRAVITIQGPGGESLPSVEGTWSQEGDKITTVLAGDTDVYTIQDGNLTINAFGENIVFEKR
jgi:hypothetical protein